MRKLLILRPEPGASATAERARALGLDIVTCPLFEIQPIAWEPPDPAGFDALLLTSASAARHGGPGLATLAALPVLAVGEATAAAARAAGFTVRTMGTAGARALLDAPISPLKLLHLTGRHHVDLNSRHDITTVVTYHAAALPDPSLPDVTGMVAAVHSPRAGARLAELVADRSATQVAAISEAAEVACGSSWQAIERADRPTDAALLALAARLCQSPA